MFVSVCGGKGGGGRTDTKTVCKTVSLEVKFRYAKLCHLRSNTEIQLSEQCRACSKINISKSKNSNLSSLLSEFSLRI